MKRIIIFACSIVLASVFTTTVDASPQCPSNLSPNQQSSDPSCFVQSSSSYYVTDGTDNYHCGPVYVKPADFGDYYCYACTKNGSEYSRDCSGPWHGYWCSNSHGGLPGSSNWSDSYGHWETVTTNTCYYISGLTGWSVCSGGAQVAIAPVTWSSKSGTDCANASLTRPCGACGPANGVESGVAPSAGLCAIGTASPVPPTLSGNTWIWQCKGLDNNATSDDVSCSAPRKENGACNSTCAGPYTWDATGYRGSYCSTGTPSSTPAFPGYGQTVTWGCAGIGTGTSTSPTACSATRGTPPPCACNSSAARSDYPFTTAAPTTPLCTAGTPTPSTISFDNNVYGAASNKSWTCSNTPSTICSGVAPTCNAQRVLPPPCACGSANNTTSANTPNTNLCGLGDKTTDVTGDSVWNWTCGATTNVCQPQATCQAKCVDIDLDVPTNLYLKKDDNTINAYITITGKEHTRGSIDCKINGASANFVSESSKSDVIYIPFIGPKMKVTALCTIDVKCGSGANSTRQTFEKTKLVQGLCTARSCSSQGSCQATPKVASSVSDCTSSCNSDADCSTGRVIETRP